MKQALIFAERCAKNGKPFIPESLRASKCVLCWDPLTKADQDVGYLCKPCREAP